MEVTPTNTDVATSSGAPPMTATTAIQPNLKSVSTRGRETRRGRDKYDNEPQVSQQRVRHYSPHTPKNFSRGRSNHRGKRGGRGNFRENMHHPQVYPYREYDNQSYHPSPGRQETRPDPYYNGNSHYYNPSPVPTHNRFSPLRDTHSSEHMRDNYNQSPYAHNSNTYGNLGFHEDRHARKRGPDPRKVVEGGGKYRGGKRKRV